MTKHQSKQSVDQKQNSNNANSTGKRHDMPGSNSAQDGSGKNLGSRSRDELQSGSSLKSGSQKSSKGSYSGNRDS